MFTVTAVVGAENLCWCPQGRTVVVVRGGKVCT